MSAVMSVQPLFTPLRMGDLDLPNRIVMAPLTRMRAGSMDHVPTALQAEYYAQRASAGLIVAEATAISADGFGYADTPGLWSADQVRGWRLDRKSTRLNSSHVSISYAVFCLKKKSRYHLNSNTQAPSLPT